MAAATLVLSIIILGVFALETLVSEGYNGPHKNVIVSALRELISIFIINNIIGIRSYDSARCRSATDQQLPRDHRYPDHGL